jgi:hypothetical protein
MSAQRSSAPPAARARACRARSCVSRRPRLHQPPGRGARRVARAAPLVARPGELQHAHQHQPVILGQLQVKRCPEGIVCSKSVTRSLTHTGSAATPRACCRSASMRRRASSAAAAARSAARARAASAASRSSAAASSADRSPSAAASRCVSSASVACAGRRLRRACLRPRPWALAGYALLTQLPRAAGASARWSARSCSSASYKCAFVCSPGTAAAIVRAGSPGMRSAGA